MHRRSLFGLSAAFLALQALPALAATHTVTIKSMTFSPKSLKVAVGDKVTFVNEDGMAHSATAGDGSFDTGNLAGGQSKTVTISAAGTHAYICSYLRGMKGTIIAG